MQTVPVVQQDTGEIQFAQIFVAVLGASNYTYAEATWSQRLPDWIGIHVRTFEFIKVVPVLLIPDNLKSSTTRACRYDPDINMSYQQMAAHYGTAIVPARPRKPQDKAKAEVGVQIIERWSLARLRHHTFFSLTELNEHIHGQLEEVNNNPFKQLKGTRQQWFDSLDKPALLPQPKQAFEFTEIKTVKVNVDYHIDSEAQEREQRKQKRLIKAARFKLAAHAQAIDYLHPRGLPQSVMASLLQCDWLNKGKRLTNQRHSELNSFSS